MKFRPETNSWIIMLADTSQAALAREALLRLHGKDENGLKYTLTRRDLETAEAERAFWSSAQLRDWFTYLTPIVMKEARDSGAVVHGFGINEAQNALAVYVGDAKSTGIVTRALARKSIPCNLVVIGVGQGVVPS